jgi:hypothetical protein
MIEPITPLRQDCDKCSLTRIEQRMFEPIQLLTGVPMRAVSEGGMPDGVGLKTAAELDERPVDISTWPFIAVTKLTTRFRRICAP